MAVFCSVYGQKCNQNKELANFSGLCHSQNFWKISFKSRGVPKLAGQMMQKKVFASGLVAFSSVEMVQPSFFTRWRTRRHRHYKLLFDKSFWNLYFHILLTLFNDLCILRISLLLFFTFSLPKEPKSAPKSLVYIKWNKSAIVMETSSKVVLSTCHALDYAIFKTFGRFFATTIWYEVADAKIDGFILSEGICRLFYKH